jgi:hypothetical protein
LSQRFLLRHCLSCSLLPFGLALRALGASRLLTRSLLPLCLLLGRYLSLNFLSLCLLPLCLLLSRYLSLNLLSLCLLLGRRLSCSLLPFGLESRSLDASGLLSDRVLPRCLLLLLLTLPFLQRSFLPGEVDDFFRRLLCDPRRHGPCDLVTPIQSNHIGRRNGRQRRFT